MDLGQSFRTTSFAVVVILVLRSTTVLGSTAASAGNMTACFRIESLSTLETQYRDVDVKDSPSETIAGCVTYCDSLPDRQAVEIGVNGTTCFCLYSVKPLYNGLWQNVSLNRCSTRCGERQDEFCGAPPDLFSIYTIVYESDNRSCEEPVIPGDVHRTGNDTSFGREIHFTCDLGMVLVGGSEVSRCYWTDFNKTEVDWEPSPAAINCVDPGSLQTTQTMTFIDTTSPSPPSSGLLRPPIIPVICGIIVALLLIIGLVVIFLRRRRRRKGKFMKSRPAPQSTVPQKGHLTHTGAASNGEDFDNDYLVPDIQKTSVAENRPRLPAPTSIKDHTISAVPRESTYENTNFFPLKKFPTDLNIRKQKPRDPAYQNREMVSRHEQTKRPSPAEGKAKPKPKPKPKTNQSLLLAAQDSNTTYQNLSVSRSPVPRMKLVPRMPTIGWDEHPSPWERPPIPSSSSTKGRSLIKQPSADYVDPIQIQALTCDQEVYENAMIGKSSPNMLPRRPPGLTSTKPKVIETQDSGGDYLEIIGRD